jgi:hypothetical protein
MPAPKFNFVPERQLVNNTIGSYTPASVTLQVCTVKQLNGKQSTAYSMRFSKDTIHIYDLNGKLIRLYGDEKKRSIGWSIIDEKLTLPELDGCRKLTATSAGVITLSIGKLLHSMNVNLSKTIPKLEVKKHIDPQMSHEIFYIEIPNE